MIPKAVLWDMDGTIIDTEPYWLEAEMEIAARYGVKWDVSDALKQVGQGLTLTSTNMRDAGVPLTIDELIHEMISIVIAKVKDKEVKPWRPGAVELIRELKANNVPMALVTMSYRVLTEVVLEALGFDAFDVVVTGDAVKHPKPHPEPYLTAAEKLKVSIEDCVVFEDSIPGIKSGAASGAVAIAAPNHVPIPESADYLMIEGFEDLTLAKLSALYTERIRIGRA